MIPLLIKTKREWHETEGYRYLAPWTNLVLLRGLVRGFTRGLSKGEYRLVHQMDDAARSAVSTLEEGWKRPTTKEYLDFLGFTQASLEEIKGDIRRCLEDGFLKSRPGSSLKDLGIDLREFKEFMGPRNVKQARARYLEEIRGKNKGNIKGEDRGKDKGEIKGNYPRNNLSNQSFNPSFNYSSNSSSNFPLRDPVATDYPPLCHLNSQSFTFEIFMELINKTDYLLRNLVVSLQKSGEQKENIKKIPWLAQEQEADKWLEEVMKKR